MSEPLSAEEEAKFRESVRLIGEDAEGDGWSWWSNTTAARLLATLDAERAASERPPVDPLRDAAQAVVNGAEPDDNFDGEFIEYLVSFEAIDALRAALASPAAPRPEGPRPDWDAIDKWLDEPDAAAPRPERLDVERLGRAMDTALPTVTRTWEESAALVIAEYQRLSDTGDTQDGAS